MKLRSIFALAALAACLAPAQTPFTIQAPPQPATPPPAERPSDVEQQDLVKAVNEASNSTLDLVRVLEAYLKKYPNSVQRLDIERAIAKAAIENRDDKRVVQYGERVLTAAPDDVLMLDKVSLSLVAMGGKDNAERAIKYARALEDLIDKQDPPTGRDAVQKQEERDRAEGRALLTQSRARTILEDKENAERVAARAFALYPSEDIGREWAECLVRLGREEDAIARFADAFTVPDPHTTDPDRLHDRLRMSELYVKLHGSEKGLGDLILVAYDRMFSTVELRHKKLLALDPNASAADATQFTVTALDGKKLQMSSLLGKVIVLDFWATWCAPCRTQHPLYEEVKKHFGNRNDLVFLPLDTDDDRTIVEPFLEEQMWDKHVYFDDGMTRILQVAQIPTTIVLDKKGRISSRMNGFLPDQFVTQLTERINTALAEK
jgi:thiol-disulfide isomerase/thioredoxin